MIQSREENVLQEGDLFRSDAGQLAHAADQVGEPGLFALLGWQEVQIGIGRDHCLRYRVNGDGGFLPHLAGHHVQQRRSAGLVAPAQPHLTYGPTECKDPLLASITQRRTGNALIVARDTGGICQPRTMRNQQGLIAGRRLGYTSRATQVRQAALGINLYAGAVDIGRAISAGDEQEAVATRHLPIGLG